MPRARVPFHRKKLAIFAFLPAVIRQEHHDTDDIHPTTNDAAQLLAALWMESDTMKLRKNGQ